MPYDAFISYSSADLPLAQDLYARLTAEGFNVWFDKTRLEPGFDWHREIEEGCEQSRVLLPVLTPRWLKSEWTRYETYGAEAIIPLVYEGPRAEVMTPPLERWQPARLDMDQADAAVWARLYAALRRCLAEPLPEKTARLDHLHGRPTDFFVGRDAELVRLHEELHRNPRTVLTQGRVRAIAATGGAGKTTLVRHYAEKFWRCYPQILWVDCRNGLELEFAELHDLIYPERAQSGFKVPEKAQSALRALNEQTRRLLILDNAEDEESALAWIPKAGGCHTLITSRYSGWSATVKTLYLFVLEKDPAMTLLQLRSGHPAADGELAACEELAAALDYLPLALEQAAAYIGNQGEAYGFRDYLRLYPRSPGQFLAKGIRRSDDYPDSVAATWQPTVARLGPAARAVLRLCAFYAATPIPLGLLVRGAPILRQCSARFGGEAGPLTDDEAEFWVREALADLKTYSLAQYDGRTCAFHALLQTVERINIPASDLEGDSAAAIALFMTTQTASDQEAVSDIRQLVPHGRALLHVGGTDYPDLFSYVGDLCERVGDCRDAMALYADALRLFVVHLGPEHPRTLLAENALGIGALRMGDYAQAEPLLRRALAGCEQVLGPTHPDTLASVNNLANLLQAQGDLAAAEPLLRRALAGCEQALGATHPDTLTSVNNLAVLLQDQGDLAAAESLCRRALEVREQVLGPAHPETVTSLKNLATLLQAKGALVEADSMVRRFLEACQSSTTADFGAYFRWCSSSLLPRTPEDPEPHMVLPPPPPEFAVGFESSDGPLSDHVASDQREQKASSNATAGTVGTSLQSSADKVHLSVSYWPTVRAGQTIIIDVWAHLERHRKEVERRVKLTAQSTDGPIIRPKGPFRIERGATLFVRLRFDEFLVDPPEDFILWEGQVGNASFTVIVPPDISEGTRLGFVTVHSQGGLLIARVPLQIMVAVAIPTERPKPLPIPSIRTAFASYASTDRDEVLGRIQGMQKIAPDLNVFLDVVQLRSGEDWEKRLWEVIPSSDIFYLFWSVAASASPWVEKEWRCALNTRGQEFIDPVPLCSPHEARPPAELSKKHFNDWVLAYYRGRQPPD